MRTKIYMIFCLAFFSSLVYAQKSEIQKANKKFDNMAYIDAIEMYEEVANKGYEDAEMFRRLGDAYYFNANYGQASKWYKKLFDMGYGQDSNYDFRYGQSLKASGNYKKADEFLSRYYQSRGESYVSTSEVLSTIKKASYQYKIDKLGFNGGYSDYPAFYRNDSLYVVSADTGDKKTPWNNEPTSELFFLDNGSTEGLQGDVNSKYNEGSMVMTKDGQTLYFTRNDYLNKKLGKDVDRTTRLKLYRAQNVNGEWSNIEELPFNSSEYSTGHPALSKDESRLYFISDMPDDSSKGGTDIYVTDIYDDGSFGDIVNMTSFNTSGNEMFPFIDSDDTFYFSSNGQLYNIGGLDVYMSKYNGNGVYGKVENLGRPINSSMDDFAFMTDPEKKVGYFATNRYGSTSDDIYSFAENENYEEPCDVELKGVVRDKETGGILENALVTLIGKDNSIIDQKVVVAGLYEFSDVDCNKVKFIRAEKSSYLTNEESLTGPLEGIVRTDILLDKRVHEFTDGSDVAIILNPIYFDRDKDIIRPDAEIELQKVIAIMKQNPKKKIDVRSHTDSRANDDYNMDLSDRRVKATINYLVNKGGIERSRLSGRGFGETQLKNGCSNGVKCSESEHQQNRRSEFIIN